MLALLNTVVVLAALGILAYTRVLYKRPAITEGGERERLAAESTKPAPITSATPGVIPFEAVTINIQPAPGNPKSEDTVRQIQGKLHYATLAFSLEVRDIGQKEQIDQIKPILMDRILTMMGKKPFHELTTVQGRYLVRSQILDMTNELLKKKPGEASLVTEVFFTQFVVQ